nr:hypothetical protein [Mucilaginibacter sp. L294]
MASPITSIPAAEEQHMLLLFLPLEKKKHETVSKAVVSLNTELKAANDLRAATGVHFFMIYHLADGKTPNLPVTSFQTMPGKDMLVVLSIYDADFTPYIASFVTNPFIAKGLNDIVDAMDESGIVDPSDQSSAEFIKNNGGVAANPDAFNCLLMRYNFGDPTVPAVAKMPEGSNYKYVLSATFPGLTVGKILQNYPGATTLWPFFPADIKYEPSEPPAQC